MNRKFTKTLDKLGKKDISIAGGKGVNLGEMIKAKLPVPKGFVVLTNAYKEIAQINNIEPKISEIFKNKKDINENGIKNKIEEIKKLFLNAQIPETIFSEIVDEYKSIGENVKVAIRSSATAEDLPGLSFAGQYSTYLNISGITDLIDSIKKCWASLWNERAVLYRIKQNIHHSNIAHAVVVQQLIDSEKSGILFTANPLNGRRDQILLNSSWGLGEAIVGGEVTPDQWIVSKITQETLEEKIAEKKIICEKSENGIKFSETDANKINKSTLNNNEVLKLLDLAIKTENYFGEPQDLEWAYAENNFYLVQSRPITSLYPVPKVYKNKKGIRVYLNISNYSQAMKEPFTTLGVDLITISIKNVIKKLGRKKVSKDSMWYYNVLGGRLFIDITAFLRKEKSWNKFKKADSNDKDPITTKALLQYLERNKKEILSHKESVNYFKVLNPRLIKYLLKGVKEYKFGAKHPEMGRKLAVESGEKSIDIIKSETEKLVTDADKINYIREKIDAIFMAGGGTLFYVASSSTYLNKVKKMMDTYLGDSEKLHLVEKSVPHSVTTQMGMELLEIAKFYDENGKKPNINDTKIKKFLEIYGHKKPIELDIGVATWNEDPDFVMNLINTYIENQRYKKGIEEFYKGKKIAENTITEIKKRFEEKGFKKQGKKAEKLLKSFREMFGIREQSKFVITQGLQIIRKMILEVGENLVKSEAIDDINDIFFLKLDDILSNKNLKEISHKNKEEFAIFEKLKDPRIITSTGESIYSVFEDIENIKDGSLIGVPVSAGVVEGFIRVLDNPEQGKDLKEGEILVAVGTNPAWTPLFLKIGGLIMETGGPISHGSVVAREYGVPAVSGIANATTVLKTGQKVRLNGETGIVQIISKETK